MRARTAHNKNTNKKMSAQQGRHRKEGGEGGQAAPGTVERGIWAAIRLGATLRSPEAAGADMMGKTGEEEGNPSSM